VTGPGVTVTRMAQATRRIGLAGRRRLTLNRWADDSSALAQWRHWTRSALLIRLVQVLAGVAVLLLAPHVRLLVVVWLLLGLLIAVLSPSRSGQAVAVGAGIAGWVFGYGAHGSPPVVRVLAFALALFLLHDATTLAATVPLAAELRREALLAWLRRSGLALLVAGLLTLVVYGVGTLVNFTTSYPLVLAGLLGIVTALCVTAWLFSRSLR
jgi:hypothetical protein